MERWKVDVDGPDEHFLSTRDGWMAWIRISHRCCPPKLRPSPRDDFVIIAFCFVRPLSADDTHMCAPEDKEPPEPH